MFASVYAFYRYVKEPGVLRLLLCAAASGLAVAVKHSGALVLPALFILAVSEIARRWLQERSRNIPGKDRHALWQLARFTSALILIAGVSYAMLWAFYGFRYQTRPSDLQLVPSYPAYLNELKDPLQRSLFGFFARHHLFPEAYLYSWIDILLIPGMRFTFVFGKLYSSGQWFFFPAMLLIKSTIPLLLLMTLVPFAGFGKYRRELLFLVIPPVFFLLIAILSNLNLGVRHILPVYPFCILLAAAAGRRIAARSRPLAAAVAGLLVLAVVSSARSFPDYLAYSNEAFGGPSNTYRVVTDANADWGQGLKWAKEYLNSNHISDCWFDYNVPFVDPTYYKIGWKQLPSAFHVLGFAP